MAFIAGENPVEELVCSEVDTGIFVPIIDPVDGVPCVGCPRQLPVENEAMVENIANVLSVAVAQLILVQYVRKGNTHRVVTYSALFSPAYHPLEAFATHFTVLV